MRRGDAMKTRLALAVLVLSVGSVASVGAGDRVRLVLNGAFDSGSLDYAQSRTFKEFAEDGTIDTKYSAGTGKGFDLGLHWRFNPHATSGP